MDRTVLDTAEIDDLDWGAPVTDSTGLIQVSVLSDSDARIVTVDRSDEPDGDVATVDGLRLIPIPSSGVSVDSQGDNNGGRLAFDAESFGVSSDQDMAGVFVAWETADGAGWELLPTTYDAFDETIQAYTEHFSVGFLASVPDLGGIFIDFLTGTTGSEPPTCPNSDDESLIDAGVGWEITRGDLVLHCVGVEGSNAIIKVTNTRRMPVEFRYPSSWDIVDTGPVSFGLGAVTEFVGDQWGEAVAPASDDLDFMIIGGGGTIVIEAPTGSTGFAGAKVSPFSWLFGNAIYGLEVLTFAVSATAGASTSAPDVAESLVSRLGSNDDVLTDLVGCFNGATGNLSFGGPSTQAEDLLAAWGILTECFPVLFESWASIYVTTSGLFASLTLGLIIKGALLIVTGIDFATQGLRAAWDNVAALFGDSESVWVLSLTTPGGGCAGLQPAERTSCQLALAATNDDIEFLRAEAGRPSEFYESCCGVPVEPRLRWDETVTYTQTGTTAELLKILVAVLRTEPRRADNGDLFWTARVDCETWQVEVLADGEWQGFYAYERETAERGCAPSVPVGGFTQPTSSIACQPGLPTFTSAVVGVGEFLHVRSGPGANNETIQRLGLGTMVSAYGDVLFFADERDWIMIILPGTDSGTECGWVAREYLNP